MAIKIISIRTAYFIWRTEIHISRIPRKMNKEATDEKKTRYEYDAKNILAYKYGTLQNIVIFGRAVNFSS